MYNLLDKDNNFVGNSKIKIGNYTTVPVKPLRFDEKAKFINGKWEYNFEKKLVAIETRFSMIDYFIIQLYFGNLEIENGTTVLEKSKDISVLIPCYGKAKYIVDCVKSCVNQTMKPYEIVVLLMDNESIALKNELEKIGATCYIGEKTNACNSRTQLVNEYCKTEWFIFLDADDLLMNNCIETLYKEKASVVYPVILKIDEQGNEITKLEDMKEATHLQSLRQNLTSLMTKTIFNEVGLDESLCNGGEDFDFNLRLLALKKYKVAHTIKSAYLYRYCENGLTKKKEFYQSHFNSVVKNIDFLHQHYIGDNEFEKSFAENPTLETLVKHFPCDKFNLIAEKRDVIEYKKSVSKFRTPLAEYNKNQFVVLNGKIENDFNFEGKTFDVMFLETVNENNCYDDFIPMVINKDIDIKGKIGWELLTYLLDNYACFESYEDTKELPDDVIFEKMKNSKNKNEELEKQLELFKLIET